MSESAKDVIHRVARSFDLIRQREEEELQKLCKEPSLFLALQVLTDRIVGDLTYLCNYDHAVDRRGNREEIVKIIEKLQDMFAASFEELTGREYVAEIVRQIHFNGTQKGSKA